MLRGKNKVHKLRRKKNHFASKIKITTKVFWSRIITSLKTKRSELKYIETRLQIIKEGTPFQFEEQDKRTPYYNPVNKLME